MKPIFVLGNGTSRLQFDLNVLKQHGRVIGCNALYRDFIPDILVAVDDLMINEIINSGIHRQCCFTIEDCDRNNNYLIKPSVNGIITNMPGKMDSGNLALLMACQYSDQVYMIGFDYISNTKFHNNVYAGSKNYKTKTDPHVLKVTEESWYYRALIVMLRNPHVNFYRVNNNQYKPPIQEFNFQNINPQKFDDQFKAYRPNIKIEEYLNTKPQRKERIGTPGRIIHSGNKV